MNRQQKHTSAAAAKKAAAELRAQLHQELESKKLCEYQPHECTQLTLEGYNYCLRHIMEDKSSPYKQCGYVYNSNGKRCHLPALKGDKKEPNYCNEHSFKTHLTRVKAAARHAPTNTVESMLSSLSHYVIPQQDRTITNNHEADDEHSVSEKEKLTVTKSLDPFVEIDSAAVNSSRSKILDYGSESDSDVEPACYATVWHDAQVDSSDAESIDSEQEDVLKHAGIYTAEEATLVTRDKLIRLQSLYIEQFKHLQHVLKERRRKYVHALKREKETLSSIHNQPRNTPKEQRLYKKLKALNHYNKKYSIDAIMHKKFQDVRTKLTEGANYKAPPFPKCTYQEGGVKCGDRALPVAKFCRKHILNDPQQVLFRRCCRVEAQIECNEPVVGLSKDAVCKYHMTMPPIRHYGETRTFEDSDVESNDAQEQQINVASTSSSKETKTQTIITPQEIVNFSNQLPSTSKEEITEDVSKSNLQQIKVEHHEPDIAKSDVTTDEIDIMGDGSPILDNAVKLEEPDSHLQTDIIPAVEEIATQDIQDESIDNEIINIDTDDDMTGIMLELQKNSNIS